MRLLRSYWDKFFLVAATLLALLPAIPANMVWPARDSGVFLYSGWRVQAGAIPYRDFWDHKPPLIYYIDAAGLALSAGTRWGVWSLEVVFLFVAAWLGFKTLKAYFGSACAFLASWIWLIALAPALQGGNLTEEFALPLQFFALYLLAAGLDAGLTGKRGMLLGVAGALAFFLKQTTTGLWVAIPVLWTSDCMRGRAFRRWMAELAWTAAGAAPVNLVVVAFFASHRSLAEAWDAAFAFNLVYSAGDVTPIARLIHGIQGVSILGGAGLWELAVLGLGLGLLRVIVRGPGDRLRSPLISVAMIDLPVEIVFVSLSGRSNPHYYVSMLPALSVLAGATIWTAARFMGQHYPGNVMRAAAILAAGLLAWSSFAVLKIQTNQLASVPVEYPLTASYVDASTPPDATLLVWGDEASINYMASRPSPTRFVYLFPLYQMGYGTKQLIAGFLRSLVQNPPDLIVDTSDSFTPFMQFRNLTPSSSQDLAWLRSHYSPVQSIGSWTLYRLLGDQASP